MDMNEKMQGKLTLQAAEEQDRLVRIASGGGKSLAFTSRRRLYDDTELLVLKSF
jgi:hypothetical protein